MYSFFIRPLLFLFDAENVHHTTFRLLKFALRFPPIVAMMRALYVKKDKQLEREICGIRFANPVGLAAGFDKDAKIGADWKHLGFGFVELGTITPRPQVGNPQKRLFRLPQDKAILNRMGFNNDGVEMAVARLQRMDKSDIIIGANIGKNKDTPNENAVDDYLICFEKLFDYVDYFVVNVSSPNTPGLRALQEKEPLTALLSTLNQKNKSYAHPKPIFLKIAPDLTDSQLDDIVEVVEVSQIQGLIATNTTISRADLQTNAADVEALGAGGISGQPLRKRSTEVIAYLSQKSQGQFPIIAVGGIMNPEDAKAKIAAGASLVQVYTGFVYGGPSLVKRILNSFLS